MQELDFGRHQLTTGIFKRLVTTGKNGRSANQATIEKPAMTSASSAKPATPSVEHVPGRAYSALSSSFEADTKLTTCSNEGELLALRAAAKSATILARRAQPRDV